MAQLFLVPNLLSDNDWQNVLPAGVYTVLTGTRYFIVENVRSARRFLKKVNKDIDIDSLNFFILNKHTKEPEISGFLDPLKQGNNIAVISEAGCPGVADPGSEVVRIAHQNNYKVTPLSGPSSIILALMASGLNGQNFLFHGYLPVQNNHRLKAIKNLEKRAGYQTQIFIETPYRNNRLIKDILSTCSPDTKMCIAANLTGKNEFISTKTIKTWKKNVPDLHKQPAIFLLGK
jgi:16S rRNA (cytidine1402-2'-O)-methyltransferase